MKPFEASWAHRRISHMHSELNYTSQNIASTFTVDNLPCVNAPLSYTTCRIVADIAHGLLCPYPRPRRNQSDILTKFHDANILTLRLTPQPTMRNVRCNAHQTSLSFIPHSTLSCVQNWRIISRKFINYWEF